MTPIAILRLGETYPDLAERIGGFSDWVSRGLADARIPRVIVDVPAGMPLPPPVSISGAILTGAHDMLTQHPPWNSGVARWIRSVAAQGRPLLGICYGHQLLAHAYGGSVSDNPHGKEYGTTEIHLTDNAVDDPLMAGMPARFAAHVCHRQSVVVLPEHAVHLAWNAHDPHQAFRIGPAAWGVQFHPEFSEAAISAYVSAAAEDLVSDGREPERLRRDMAPTPAAGGILKRFAHIVARGC
jgi:GMP synthase (glutamine-hydrolysing)